ncbi:Ger(x)C family spore germination protein [Bacillus sp. DNRA2]|uniref:Ger(x)C family spore germination protein n=1 Tax=Bacillus sp. DNRA2 TaxID=2723053 RepID=UPI00145C5517|nr:Ger(x)C family spore germination protein [Bacillus sp. DNRA2]NMD70130.1 Ger(x)C family spore germination protein [Bacillus sp. DNRA2]
MIFPIIKKINSLVMVIWIGAVSLLLTGCWDRQEINDVAIVLSTGIDYVKDDELEISAEFVIPEIMSATRKQGTSGAGVRTTFIESATGKTLAEARSKLQEKIARSLFWGHADATVFGEEMAKKGIKEHLDYFARTPDARLRNTVFVCEGKAKDIISATPHLEDSASDTLNELSNFQISMDVTMSELMQMTGSETGGALLPFVKQVSSSQKGKMKSKTQILLSGVAVFNGNKMIGKLDESVTRGLLWVRDEIKNATITVEVDEGEDGEGEGKITALMIQSQTKLIPRIEHGKWIITIQCSTEDDLVQNASKLDIRKGETIHLLEGKFEEKIEERMKQAVEIVQKDMKVDVLKFNRAFQRKYRKEWKKRKGVWTDMYPNIEVQYDVTAKILRPGLSSEPPAVPNNEVKQ